MQEKKRYLDTRVKKVENKYKNNIPGNENGKARFQVDNQNNKQTEKVFLKSGGCLRSRVKNK